MSLDREQAQRLDKLLVGVDCYIDAVGMLHCLPTGLLCGQQNELLSCQKQLQNLVEANLTITISSGS